MKKNYHLCAKYPWCDVTLLYWCKHKSSKLTQQTFSVSCLKNRRFSSRKNDLRRAAVSFAFFARANEIKTIDNPYLSYSLNGFEWYYFGKSERKISYYLGLLEIRFSIFVYILGDCVKLIRISPKSIKQNNL